MTMFLLLFLVLSAPGVWAAAARGRRFEELLGVSAMGVVLLLFFFGLLGGLKAGVYAVLLLAAGFWLLACRALLIREKRRAFLGNLMTPGFWMFAVAFVTLAILNRGRLANTWDEFSHWIDVVKVMTALDDFSTNPKAFSGYGHYPPGMALFQYFFQKIRILCGGVGFSEADAYTAYQMLSFSLLLPLTKRLDRRKPVMILLYLAAVFAAPLMFHNFFASLFIDGFLGVCSGVGMTMIFLYKEEEKDSLYTLSIAMLCAMLVLAKDAGLGLAVCLAAAFLADHWLRGNGRKWSACAAVVLGTAVPKLLWMLEVRLAPTILRTNPPVIQRGISGADRMKILRTFALGLYERELPIGNSGISFSCIGLLLLALAALCLLYPAFKTENRRGRAAVLVTLGVQMIAWVAGMGVMYLVSFVWYESINLLCFERYLGTALLPVLCLTVFAVLDILERKAGTRPAVLLAAFFVLLAVVPTRPLVNMVSRSYVSVSKANRTELEQTARRIEEVCEPGSFVYLVDQNHVGGDFWQLKFLVRPVIVKNVNAWSLGTPSPNDLCYTQDVTAQQWRQELLQEYDYVMLLHIDAVFLERYAELFENPADIADQALFRVDRQDGLLKIAQGE